MFTFLAGRKVAIDASMSLYQFLIAVRSDGAQLVGSDGETTRCVCVCVRTSMCNAPINGMPHPAIVGQDGDLTN